MLIINEYTVELCCFGNKSWPFLQLTMSSDVGFVADMLFLSAEQCNFKYYSLIKEYKCNNKYFFMEIRQTPDKRGFLEFMDENVNYSLPSEIEDASLYGIEDLLISPKEIIKAINDKNKQ